MKINLEVTQKKRVIRFKKQKTLAKKKSPITKMNNIKMELNEIETTKHLLLKDSKGL